MDKSTIYKSRIKVSNLRGSFIYFLMQGKEIVYVGQTKMGLSRVLFHCNNKVFDSYTMVQCKEEELNDREAYYIHIFEPKYNNTAPSNSDFMRKSLIKKRYKIEGNALNKILKIFNITSEFIDVKRFDEIFKKCINEEIIIKKTGYSDNNDWFVNTEYKINSKLY